MLEYEVLDACLKLLRDMFMLKPGETIAITTDTMSSAEIVEATAQGLRSFKRSSMARGRISKISSTFLAIFPSVRATLLRP